MKKHIILYFLVFGLLVEGADYNSMKDMILDTENAIGKTINYDGEFAGLRAGYDWNRQRRPAMTVRSLKDRYQYLNIFFNKKFNERVKNINDRQLVNVTCRMKSFGIINTCELIDFTLIKY